MKTIRHDFIRLLTAEDRPAYERLLQSAFENPKNFSVEPPGKKWTLTDNYYPVLGLFINSQLVAMMRIEWIDTDDEFQFKFKDQTERTRYAWPLGYLAKAATMKGFEGMGLNSVLRFHCLKILQSWDVTGVIGVMVEGSPRIQIMQRMGYDFFPLNKPWTETFKSEKKVLLAELIGKDKIEAAIAFLQNEFSDLISQFNYLEREFKIRRRGRVPHQFPWMVKKNSVST